MLYRPTIAAIALAIVGQQIALIRLRANVALAEQRVTALDRKLPVTITVNVADPSRIGPTLHALLPAIPGVPAPDLGRHGGK